MPEDGETKVVRPKICDDLEAIARQNWIQGRRVDGLSEPPSAVLRWAALDIAQLNEAIRKYRAEADDLRREIDFLQAQLYG